MFTSIKFTHWNFYIVISSFFHLENERRAKNNSYTRAKHPIKFNHSAVLLEMNVVSPYLHDVSNSSEFRDDEYHEDEFTGLHPYL